MLSGLVAHAPQPDQEVALERSDAAADAASSEVGVLFPEMWPTKRRSCCTTRR